MKIVKNNTNKLVALSTLKAPAVFLLKSGNTPYMVLSPVTDTIKEYLKGDAAIAETKPRILCASLQSGAAIPMESDTPVYETDATLVLGADHSRKTK